MAKLISIGELIIDFSSIGNKSLKDTEKFIKNAGGLRLMSALRFVN